MKGEAKMRILVGLSGGVDSAYAAYILKREGHEVEGAVLRMHEYTEVDAALSVARTIGVPCHVIDLTERFASCVVANFKDEYSQGRTPNPCILCNPEVKFRGLYDYAAAHGFDRIATGHYARVERREGRFALSRADDSSKDQTYMLYRLPQEILSVLLLPLSEMKKSDIRQSAELLGLVERGTRESQEICFIPSGDYAEYILRDRSFPEGDFVDREGRVLGRHRGIIRYTVGQRRGLGVSLGERAYVERIDSLANTVTLSTLPKGDKSVCVSDTVYSAVAAPTEQQTFEATVRLRYRGPLLPATVTLNADGTARLSLHTDGVMATPGQSAVIYDGDTVLLGGIITDRE